MEYDLVIVGAGPAGLTASIYAKRFGLKVLVIGEEIGGLLNVCGEIRNYPGFIKIEGTELLRKFYEHALSYEVEIAQATVTDIKKEGALFKVETSIGNFKAKAIIIATGSKKRKLGIEGEEEFAGKGVCYCTVCDAPLTKGKRVGVVGCGNSACESALLLSQHAGKVYLFCKHSKLKCDEILKEKVERERKIEVICNANIRKIFGEERMKGALFEMGGEEKKIEMDFLFVEIGREPSLELATKLGLEIEDSLIKVDEKLRTSQEGIFAAGDITTGSSKLCQIVTACAEGAIAAKSAYEYLTSA